ncbi:MAG TPA: LysE family transporter [Acidobacteriota bacterium]|nr:LysE family transporter [Acidobacteriota bacterium]HQF87722.1 LysE family transporter [Acidobacteriota bacterium]HQG93190.1 LysE family transporter [Acidobacteriota bacterium]
MWLYLVLGISFGFASGIQPGPLMAYLVGRSMVHGWRRTLPAVLAPLISDGPIALLMLVLLTRLPAGMERGMRLAGAVFLFYLAAQAFRTWRRSDAAPPDSPGSAGRSLFQATAVNFLNPGPYLGWSLVLGPALLEGWRESPACGVALLAGFYGTILGVNAGVVILSGTARRLGPRAGRALVGLSALAMAGFGFYQLWAGLVG